MYNFISTKQEFFSKGMFEFTNNFELDFKSELTLNIYASTRYILYINDEYICEGPCRGSSDVRYYDTITTDKTKAGLNTVKLVVMHLTKKNEFSSSIKSNRHEIMFNADKLKNSWEIKDKIFTIHLSGAEGIEKHIIMPNGETHRSTDKLFNASCQM